VTITNMNAKSATISVYNTARSGIVVSETVLVAYESPPSTDAARKACLQMSDVGKPELTGTYGLAALTGQHALVLGPGRQVTIYNGAPKATDGGTVQLVVKTEALF
jgi:hypothetical protein